MTVETQQGNGVTASPATPPAPAPDLGKLVQVVETLAAQVGEIKQTQAQLGEVTQATRSKLQEKFDSLLTEANQLRQFKERVEKSGLDKLPDGTAVADVVAHKDQLNHQMAADLQALQQRLDDAERKEKRRDLEALVFAKVRPEARGLAETLYTGILTREGIDIDKAPDLGVLASQLTEKINTHLSALGGAATRAELSTAHQVQDPSTVNWDSFKHWSEIPPELKPHVPQDVYNRMASTSGGGRGGGKFNL
jgi:hypothetical protein